MYCNKCLSKNTRITCTQHKGKITVRYQRCLDCKNKFITNEVHVKKQKTPFSSKGYKLNEEKVRIIRKTVIKDSDTIFNMATEYGVEYDTIEKVLKYKTWKHVN